MSTWQGRVFLGAVPRACSVPAVPAEGQGWRGWKGKGALQAQQLQRAATGQAGALTWLPGVGGLLFSFRHVRHQQ